MLLLLALDAKIGVLAFTGWLDDAGDVCRGGHLWGMVWVLWKVLRSLFHVSAVTSQSVGSEAFEDSELCVSSDGGIPVDSFAVWEIPVEPKPPPWRSVSGRCLTILIGRCVMFSTIACAILSPFFIW